MFVVLFVVLFVATAKHWGGCPWWGGGPSFCLVFAWVLFGVCLVFFLVGAPLVLWSCSSVLWRGSCLSVRVFLFLLFWALALFLFFCSWSFVLCFLLLFFRSLLSRSCSSAPVLSFFPFCPFACPFMFSATSLSTTTRLFETQILPFCDFFSFIISKSFLFYLF